MKILIVTNLYPPHFLGGYEIRCAQVAEALSQRGHEVRILTSVYGLPVKFGTRFRPTTEVVGRIRVDRWLHNYSFGPQQRYRPWVLFQAKRELADTRGLVDVLTDFKPHVVNCWNMNGIAKLLLPVLESRDIPTVHWIEDSWMINDYGPNGEKASQFWTAVWNGSWGPLPCHPFLRWIGRKWEERVARAGLPTRGFSNRPTMVSFVSEYLRTVYREAGLEFQSSAVRFGGIPATRFYTPLEEKHRKEGRLRVLYAGQITADRGVHTLVEALGQMPSSLRKCIDVTIVGASTGVHHSYYRQVVGRIDELGLTSAINLVGRVGHDQMAQIYMAHDLLVFTSTRPEGLPLVMAEAMVAGCAIVTTGSGGAQEIADLGQFPVFPKGDSQALAALLRNLLEHPERVQELATRGQAVALQELTLERMIERWEQTLLRLSGHSSC